jgi:hypothetical protein
MTTGLVYRQIFEQGKRTLLASAVKVNDHEGRQYIITISPTGSYIIITDKEGTRKIETSRKSRISADLIVRITDWIDELKHFT